MSRANRPMYWIIRIGEGSDIHYQRGRQENNW
jgi:hypothetical protein